MIRFYCTANGCLSSETCNHVENAWVIHIHKHEDEKKKSKRNAKNEWGYQTIDKTKYLLFTENQWMNGKTIKKKY